MTFTPDELRHLLYCASEELRARNAGKSPGPAPWLRNLVRRLQLEVAVSESGHPIDDADPESEQQDERITARQAAAILGLSKRQTQRLANDLEGELIDGRWEFRLSAVTEYAEGLTDARSTA